MKFEFTKNNIILIVILLMVMFLGLFLSDYKKSKPEISPNKSKIKLVTDYSRFFSISNAGNQYIGYLKKQDSDNLLLLFNDDYIKKNDLNKENILNNLILLDSNKEYTFEARTMYEEAINENIIKYYIHGYLIEDSMKYVKPSDCYLIINLDKKNMLYDVTPYDGDIFKEEL